MAKVFGLCWFVVQLFPKLCLDTEFVVSVRVGGAVSVGEPGSLAFVV